MSGLATALLLLGALAGQADASVSPRLVLVVSRAQGMSSVEQQALREALAQALGLYGATVRPSSLSGALPPSCLESPPCSRDAASSLQVDALVDTRALRVGPSLRLTLRVLAGPSGELVEELQATTLASDPAGELAVHDALQRAVAIARQYTPPDLPAPATAAPPATVDRAGTTADAPPEEAEPSALRPLWRALAAGATGLGAGLVLGGLASGVAAALTLQELGNCLDATCAQETVLDVRARRLGLSASLLLASGALCASGGAAGLLLTREVE